MLQSPEQKACSVVIYHGTIIHSLDLGALEILEDAHLGVQNGKVIFLEQDLGQVPKAYVDDNVVDIPPGKFLIPGFVDTHTHASQFSFRGCGRIPLLDWLKKYTYPTEQRYGDTAYANEIYNKCVERHLRAGTTTCCYFATIHTKSTLVLCDVISKLGQRAFVGKLSMDRNSPDYYVEETTQSIAEAESFVKTVLRDVNNPLIQPIITPRFVPTCTTELLAGLGAIAEKYNVPIQSHISENKDEVQWVKELEPSHESYADVYHSNGLLNSRTIMAHGIYLTESERSLMKSVGAGVSHCPNSNFSIHSGILNTRRLLNEGIKVGLGTDVAGGYNVSILDAIRQTLIASDCISYSEPQFKSLSYKEAFHLATVGGAALMGLPVGNFAVGNEFDGLVIDLNSDGSPVDVFSTDTIADMFEKFIFSGDDRNICDIYVRGKQIMKNHKLGIV